MHYPARPLFFYTGAHEKAWILFLKHESFFEKHAVSALGRPAL
jgi:hypothetical protein